MGWEASIALGIVILGFLVGLAGTFLPILPGPLVAWAGVLIHKLWLGSQSVAWWVVVVITGVMVITHLLDLLLTWWGAKHFGASWKGALGALVGGIAGFIFFNILGMIVGPFVGAFVFEWIDQRNTRQAVRAGWGSFIGGLLAFAAKGALVGLMAGLFFVYLPW